MSSSKVFRRRKENSSARAPERFVTMSEGRWITKKDVLLDLALASGQPVSDINEKFLVVGERPPQLNIEDEELDEIQNWYDYKVPKEDDVKPDLPGITQMLRMVDDCTTMEAASDKSDNLSKIGDCTNSVVVISKLNPNVPDFKPSTHTNLPLNSNLETSNSIGERDNTNNSNEALTITIDGNSKDKTNENNIDINKRLDISKLKEIEKEMLLNNLKTKICSTSNNDCAKVKRQRNLAIATLLKLCSPPTTAIQQPETNSSPIPKRKTPKDSQYPLCGGKQENLSESNTKLKNFEVTSQEVVKESIEKWLIGPEEKAKSQTLFLGPITFKKKAITKYPESQSSTADTNDNISDFKPSNYASELSEKYKQRVKDKEGPMDIWTKLEMELKAKDENIKKQNRSASTISESE